MTMATSDHAEAMLAGPRGRRLALEYALISELDGDPIRTAHTFGHAVVEAAMDSRPGRLAPTVAERFSRLEIMHPTPETLRRALGATAGNARYWEAPDGFDVLAASREMRDGLLEVAELLVASESSTWWRTPAPVNAQITVDWGERAGHRESYLWQAAERSSAWSSCPTNASIASTRELWDETPAGLWFVEDSLGWEAARSRAVRAPKKAAVFEIASAGDWAGLCERFPAEAMSQRKDWGRATGREDRWVIPDWARVAEYYDGVHLQVGAYLAAAGVPISVGGAHVASMMAGWNPDETYWFRPLGQADRSSSFWSLDDDGCWRPRRRVQTSPSS